MFHRLYSDLEQGFWQFGCETRILFAPGRAAERLGPLVEGRVGLLTDAGVSGLGFTRSLREALGPRLAAEAWIGFESDVADIRGALSAFREAGVERLVAVGGGSVLDGAKVVAALLHNGLEPMALKAVAALERSPVPLIAVPTTFGTGAEVNQYAHVNDRAAGRKLGLKKSWLTPAYALIDPAVMMETPRRLRHLAGIDAWLHLFEVATLARERSPIGDLLMHYGLDLCLTHLHGCVHQPDLDNGAAIALASLLGGLGIHNARTGLIHTLAIPYARRAGVGHAESLLPFILPVIEFNWPAVASRFGDEPFGRFRRRLEERLLFDGIGEGAVVTELRDEAEPMAGECLEDQVLAKENLFPLSEEVFARLYRLALGGA